MIQSIKDSVETSIKMGLFANIESASVAHIFNSELTKYPLSKCKILQNFNPDRLRDSAIKAYPVTDRPRGQKDISSVKHHQKIIQNGEKLQPIWILIRNEDIILLDGVHRIVASYIERRKYIDAYVINI